QLLLLVLLLQPPQLVLELLDLGLVSLHLAIELGLCLRRAGRRVQDLLRVQVSDLERLRLRSARDEQERERHERERGASHDSTPCVVSATRGPAGTPHWPDAPRRPVQRVVPSPEMPVCSRVPRFPHPNELQRQCLEGRRSSPVAAAVPRPHDPRGERRRRGCSRGPRPRRYRKPKCYGATTPSEARPHPEVE